MSRTAIVMSEDQLHRLIGQLRLFQRRQRSERPAIEGLSRSAVRVLGAVARSASAAQPTLLARELVMTSSNVAAALRELDDARLVKRAADKTDSRRVTITLTAAGRRLVERDRATRDAWLVTAIGDVLTRDDAKVLLAAGGILERLAGHHPGSATDATNATNAAGRQPAGR